MFLYFSPARFFCFILPESNPRELLYLKSYQIDQSSQTADSILSAILKMESGVLDRKYNKVIRLHSGKSVVCPTDLYDADNMELYYRYSYQPEKDEQLHGYTVDAPDITVIYPEHRKEHRLLKKAFGEYTLLSADASLIQYLGKMGPYSKEGMMHCDIGDGFLTLCVYREDQFYFLNSFEWSTREDILYYVLFVTKQLRLSPESCEYRLSGELRRSGDISNLLARYVKNPTFAETSLSTYFTGSFREIPRHRYFKYLTPLLCELLEGEEKGR